MREKLVKGDCPDGDIIKRVTDVYTVLTDDKIDMDTKYKTAHFLINQIIYSKKDNVLRIECK